ncbi:MAG: helicase associated domain-containing protein [Evtepia gabavorous]
MEQLGICWAPNQSRRQEYLQAAQAYHQATGGLDIPADCTTETGLRLGAWLANQRKRYRAGTLSSRRIRELEALGVQWEPPSPDRWEEMFSLARAYYQDHGHLRIGVSYVTEDGRALGRWIAQQRRKFRRGAGEGCARHRNTKNTGWTRSEWYGTRIGNDGGRNTRWQRPTTRPMAI